MPRTYCKGKRLKAMHEKHGVALGRTCNTCYYLRDGHCLRVSSDQHYTLWNRVWPACGLFEEQDDGIEGFEWVDTDDGWKLRRKA